MSWPQGHVELKRFLTVPIFQRERIIAVLGVANKTPPYDSADERQLALLFGSVFSRLERVRAEVLLAESEARFKAVVGSMDGIVFTLDTEGRYTGVYGRWFERFGTGPDSYLGKTNREIMGFEAAASQDAALSLALRGQRASYEWTLVGDHGAGSYQTVLTPLYSGSTISCTIQMASHRWICSPRCRARCRIWPIPIPGIPSFTPFLGIGRPRGQ